MLDVNGGCNMLFLKKENMRRQTGLVESATASLALQVRAKSFYAR